jgi:hypothetical protein
MGLLDDAIREHLDLKRRRGADPSEIERAEREALGPVRRGPEEPEASALSTEEEADEYGHEYESEPYADEPHEGEPEEHHQEEPEEPRQPETGARSEETVEFRVEDHPEGEDMLEETPDFLQDTPEHDRLWFEQRPPKDFDFDG